MQLFRSLWNNDLDSAGFTLRNARDKTLIYDSLVIQTDPVTKYLKRKGIVNISYLSKWDETQINILQDSVYFNRFGYFDPYVIKWNGEMANKRIGDMLPYDYVYEKTTIKLTFVDGLIENPSFSDHFKRRSEKTKHTF